MILNNNNLDLGRIAIITFNVYELWDTLTSPHDHQARQLFSASGSQPTDAFQWAVKSLKKYEHKLKEIDEYHLSLAF